VQTIKQEIKIMLIAVTTYRASTRSISRVYKDHWNALLFYFVDYKLPKLVKSPISKFKPKIFSLPHFSGHNRSPLSTEVQTSGSNPCQIFESDCHFTKSKTKCFYCSVEYKIEGSKGSKPGIQSRYKTKDGYIMLYYPTHPSTTKGGKILEHRVVAEEKLGRSLKKGEHVHHINGISDDNRAENLEIISPEEHARVTARESLIKRRKNKEELQYLRVIVQRYKTLYGELPSV
jgi:hypothetical protein